MEAAAAEYVLPAIMSGIGYMQQQSAQEDAAAQKRQILNAQLERDDQASKKAVQMVNAEGQNYAGDKQLNEMGNQEQIISDQQAADLKIGAGGKEAGSFDTAGDAGAVSEDFIKGKADKAVTEGNRLTAIAREIAKNRSAGSLQTDEAQRRANLTGELQTIAGSNKNMADAAKNDANAVTADTGLGALASAIGSGLMAGAGKGGIGVPIEQMPAPVVYSWPKPVSGINF